MSFNHSDDILTLGGAGNLTIKGVISGQGEVMQTGTGHTTLLGANTYTGTTMVSNGTLENDGTINGNTMVTSGATLQGNGTIAGTLTSGKGSIVSTAAPNSTGNTPVSIDQPVQLKNTVFIPDSGANGLVALQPQSGVVDLSGAALQINLMDPNVPDSTVETIIDNSKSGNAVSGSFIGLPEGAVVAAAGQAFKISYAGGAAKNNVTLTKISASLVKPDVTAQPSNQIVSVGDTATFKVSAVGALEPTVQWQVSTDGGKTFSNLTGATSTTLSITNATAAMNQYRYEAVFTNATASATTTAASLTVARARHHDAADPPIGCRGSDGYLHRERVTNSDCPMDGQCQRRCVHGHHRGYNDDTYGVQCRRDHEG